MKKHRFDCRTYINCLAIDRGLDAILRDDNIIRSLLIRERKENLTLALQLTLFYSVMTKLIHSNISTEVTKRQKNQTKEMAFNDKCMPQIPHQISLSSGKKIFDRVPKTLCAKVFCHLFKQSISCTGTIKYTLFGVHFSTHIFIILSYCPCS